MTRSTARKKPRKDDPLFELGELVQRETGIRMPPEKRTFLQCRLERRLRTLGLESFDSYWEHVKREGDAEIKALIDVVTTNKTDFYREPAHFDFLLRSALPKLIRTLGRSQLRAWCAGCSTGEEPYTLAMTLSEAIKDRPGFDFRILATDISTRVLTHARLGIYERAETDALPATWRERYIARSKDPRRKLARVRPELRRRISFHRLNFMDAHYPVPKDFHIVFFRNVAIYFERPIQHTVVTRLSSHLLPGGYFFMGHSESLQTRVDGLKSIGASIYERV